MEEIINAITHGLGLFLSIAGMVVLVTLASLYGDVRHIVSCSIYGTTLILLYMASTLYHSARPASRKKTIFKILDHSCIFLLIAGTYTPFTMVSLPVGWGWSIFGVVWGLAVLGISYKMFFINHAEWFSTTVYLAMGWLIMIAYQPLKENVPTGALVLLIAGGLAYSGGVIPFLIKKLPFNHGVWHVFVLTGSILHFLAVTLYIIPLS
ncbi:MAG: hemolysin III family protein [SAR324 cluster bacterium]|nr:hemolysin III family protein [SAR324 cluster bacterium]